MIYKIIIFLLKLLKHYIKYMFMFSLIVFCSLWKHLLLTLISLEFYLHLLFLFLLKGMSMILSFVVCEGVMSLSILVSTCRGNDNLKNIIC